MIEVGDSIKTAVGGPYKVVKIDDSGLIWFKIKNGLGQTIASHIVEIIKLAK